MTVRVCLLCSLLFSFGVETYQAACIAFDPAAKAIYISEVFEQDCKADVSACREGVADQWTAFLKKEGLAQTPSGTLQCMMYKDGSRPGQSPRSRVRSWRDEEAAQAQAADRTKYTKVVQTTFQLD